MKKLLFLGIILMQSIILFGQIKVFSGGSSIIGSNNTPLTGYKLQITGKTIFSTASTSPVSAAMIKSFNDWSSASWLDYTWHGDTTTGIFHPSSNVIGFSVGGSEKMRIHSNGFLGLGTNNPGFLLDVKGRLRTQSSDGSTTAGMWFTNLANTQNRAFIGMNTDNYIGLYSQYGSGWGFLMNVTNGNVGINASAPSQKLEVSGNALVNGADKRFYIANTNRYVGMASSSDLGLINKESTWLRIASGNGIALFSNQAGAETATTGFKMFIDANGVGIGGGQAYSSYKLVVYGDALTTSAQWYTSDVQYKDDITTIVSPLVLLNQVTGKKYKYKTSQFPNMNFPQGYTYGVIAQDLGNVFPELVQSDGNGYLAVNYIGLIPVLIEAVKEQQQQITQLKNDLAICCLSPKSNQKSINDGTSENESQNNMQGLDTRTNNSENPKLYQNTPNPFNTRTEIKYYLPEKSIKAAILVFDMQGKLLKTNNLMNKGNGSLEIFGGELKPGMYMYSLIIDSKEIDTKRMILTEQ